MADIAMLVSPMMRHRLRKWLVQECKWWRMRLDVAVLVSPMMRQQLRKWLVQECKWWRTGGGHCGVGFTHDEAAA